MQADLEEKATTAQPRPATKKPLDRIISHYQGLFTVMTSMEIALAMWSLEGQER